MAAFAGGVHPPDYKELTANLPIIDIDLPDTVTIPLQQHMGVPCKPCVKKKETVTVGQLIGEPQGRISAPVHASVAGTVTDISPQPHPSGKRVEAVTIEIDKNHKPWPGQCTWPWKSVRSDTRTSEMILEAIAGAGIVGMGGAGFPTHVKLSPPPDKPIDMVILNGCECEPFLTSDHRLMVEQSGAIAAGMALIMQVLKVTHSIVAIEDNKPDAIAALRAVQWPNGVEIRVLPTRYPQGAEKILIQAITGREVPSEGLPRDVGVIVQNVATAAAIAQAVHNGVPLTCRVVTVTGGGVNRPGNYRVPLGVTVGDLLAAAGGKTDDAGAVVFGGPMMGVTQATPHTPIIKTTSGIVVFTEDEIADVQQMPCLRCGACIDACPMRLLPMRLSIASQHDRLDLVEDLSILDCMECGSCVYACPSHRSLLPWIRLGKLKITAAEKTAA